MDSVDNSGRPPAAINETDFVREEVGEITPELGSRLREIPLVLLGRDPGTGAPPRLVYDPTLLLEYELVAWGKGSAWYVRRGLIPHPGDFEARQTYGPRSSAVTRSALESGREPDEEEIGRPGGSCAFLDVSYGQSGPLRPESSRGPWASVRRAIAGAEVAVDRAQAWSEALAAWSSRACRAAWTLLGSRRGPGAAIEIPTDGRPFVVPAEPWERERRALAALFWALAPLALIVTAILTWIEVMKRAFPGGLR